MIIAKLWSLGHMYNELYPKSRLETNILHAHINQHNYQMNDIRRAVGNDKSHLSWRNNNYATEQLWAGIGLLELNLYWIRCATEHCNSQDWRYFQAQISSQQMTNATKLRKLIKLNRKAVTSWRTKSRLINYTFAKLKHIFHWNSTVDEGWLSTYVLRDVSSSHWSWSQQRVLTNVCGSKTWVNFIGCAAHLQLMW